ncbi:AsmA family protein [Desulfohalovibrio reitneri]|uniref:AsmA family protein n=1 Tax=Desulfohalovibrio reitneri TaxID=1307759 RepID=UPI0004A74778|nr:AsmA family protein [Desulfohalovibrio reitneri]
MRKVLKGLLFAVAGLVLLLVLAAVILPMIVDPNDYKPLIAEQVQKATGREFSIGGDIELSVFPWIGAAIEGPIVLGNAEGFGPEPMARLDAVDVKVKLLPLLRKEVFMRTVVLRGPNINLAKNERGITNWDDLVERQGKAEPTPSPAPDTGDGQATAMPKVSLGGVALDNGQVAWKDKSTGLEAVVSDLNLNVGALTLDPGTVIPIEMTCSLRANQPEASADLRLQTRANVNQQAKRATLASTDIRLSQISAVLAEGQPHLRGSTEISGDFDVAWGPDWPASARCALLLIFPAALFQAMAWLQP